MRQHPLSQSGFTLVEMLVALFILGLVASAGAGLLMGATGAGQQVRDQEARVRQLDIAQALMRNDISAMTSRAVQEDDGFGEALNLLGESAPSAEPLLQFVRADWLNPNDAPRSNLQAVTYRLSDGALVRTARLRPDATTGTPVSQRVLLNGISRIDAGFMRGGEWSSEWNVSRRTSAQILPDLIRLKIVFETGEAFTLTSLTGVRQ